MEQPELVMTFLTVLGAPRSFREPENLRLFAFACACLCSTFEFVNTTFYYTPCCGTLSKKLLTRVSKRVPGAHGKRGLERGWQKRLAKGWRKVGEGLAKGWHSVGEGLADFLAPSNFGIPEAPV